MGEVGSYYQEADAPHWVCKVCGHDVLQVLTTIRCGARPGRDYQWRHANGRAQLGVMVHAVEPVPADQSHLADYHRDTHGVWTCRACDGAGRGPTDPAAPLAVASCPCCGGLGVHWPGERCRVDHPPVGAP